MIWRTVRIFHISDENIPNIYSRNKLPHSEIPKKFFPRYSFSGSNTKMVEKTSYGYISNKNRNINEHRGFRSVKKKKKKKKTRRSSDLIADTERIEWLVYGKLYLQILIKTAKMEEKLIVLLLLEGVNFEFHQSYFTLVPLLFHSRCFYAIHLKASSSRGQKWDRNFSCNKIHAAAFTAEFHPSIRDDATSA